jgi:hypothetical protein
MMCFAQKVLPSHFDLVDYRMCSGNILVFLPTESMHVPGSREGSIQRSVVIHLPAFIFTKSYSSH